MNQKISIIVPVYKVEKYIKKCIDSLLHQTYKNIEIILVDDGSTDNCPQICDEYAKMYENIIVYHKENGGLSSARNYGVQMATADWIVFVDSDDYVEENYVKDLWILNQRYSADLVITSVVREYDGEKSNTDNQFDPYLVNSRMAIYEVYGSFKVGWCAYGKLFKRTVLLANPFPDGYYEDCSVMYKILHASKRIVIADYRYNYHYLYRKDSILSSALNDKHYHIFEICEEFDEFQKNNYPDLYILSLLLKKSAVVQLLTLQTMSIEQYKYIFAKYKSIFKDNVCFILNNKELSIKTKIIFILLCTNPYIFKFAFECFAHK